VIAGLDSDDRRAYRHCWGHGRRRYGRPRARSASICANFSRPTTRARH
jgi:hypothetical protein